MSERTKKKRRIKPGRVIPLLVGVVILFIGCFLFGYYHNNKEADFISDIKTILRIEETRETIVEVSGEDIEVGETNKEDEDGTVTIAKLPEDEGELKEYLTSQATPEGKMLAVAKEAPPAVKGIYVTGPVAGHERMEEIIQLVEETELNAVVIDVKNDDGYVTYAMSNETVEALGARVKYVKDMPGLIDRLHEKGIYVIARIVAFRDPHLAEAKPEWSVHRTNGSIYYDNSGLAWVNPYKREVWDYLVEIAECAVADGFDEIQFDYVRFSTEIKPGEVDYGEDSATVSKTEIITEFTQYAHDKLSPLGVYVSADVFGTIIDNKNDSSIVGQDYAAISSNLDVICPMIYPSHYASGVYNQTYPNSAPYEMITGAMQASDTALASLPEEEKPIVRPWLQDFTASWIKPYHAYGAKEVREQIQAVYDAGYSEWILWNASNRYTKEALLPAE
ncbi:MAG: putative glycoside hydrolase [Lachnospiraceae bacterium]|nr:putative glycoside hydrolase [Lachnospiraceae bacterium]